ncbi:MAG: transcriptional repressor [Firmicutes bacterium]|nr:transcriptional repressor [Bacillota bacterium]
MNLNNDTTKNTGSYLKEYDIKPSYQRIKIFEYLRNTKSHPTVDEIFKEIVQEIPTLSKTTVYNTLSLFIEKGIVTVITIEENETRYDADTSLHGHFKCKSCGKVYDFDIKVSKEDIGDLDGFEVDEKHLYFKGSCKACLKNKLKQ